MRVTSKQNKSIRQVLVGKQIYGGEVDSTQALKNTVDVLTMVYGNRYQDMLIQ